MRKYIILFFSVLSFLYACNWSGRPDGVIDPDRMVDLLTDIHLADGGLINLMQTPDTLYKYGTGKFAAVFKKYNVDSAQFRKSYKYYSTQPDQFLAMYDKISKKLTTKSDSVTKLLTAENTRKFAKSKPLANGKFVTPTKADSAHMHQPKTVMPVTAKPSNYGAFQKARAHRDSLLKLLKNKHALPAK